jgi:hypothetical protein
MVVSQIRKTWPIYINTHLLRIIQRSCNQFHAKQNEKSKYHFSLYSFSLHNVAMVHNQFSLSFYYNMLSLILFSTLKVFFFHLSMDFIWCSANGEVIAEHKVSGSAEQTMVTDDDKCDGWECSRRCKKEGHLIGYCMNDICYCRDHERTRP